MRRAIPILLAGLMLTCSRRAEEPGITGAELFQHLSYLASDSLKGRLPGTPEDELAARYIAGEFRSGGLEWLTEGGLQEFEVITDLDQGPANHFRVADISGSPDVDFAPFPFSANASIEAEVVFAGYGIELGTGQPAWNDYEGIDVRGKWVMVLRGNIEIDSNSSVFHAYSNERDKAMLAADKGASGILFVSGPVFDPEDRLTDLAKREGKTAIPAIHIQRPMADLILAGSGKTISGLESAMVKGRKPLSLNTGVTVSASAEVIPATETTYNVIGFLEGRHRSKKNSVIVLGAHYDHLGMGGEGSSSRRPDTIAVHNGADDNASGVAALIEIAEMISQSAPGPGCSYLFIAFGAEEMGLLGSKHYVENPLLPIDSILVMMNFDMVGRLRENLQVAGTGTALEFKEIILSSESPDDSLNVVMSDEGYGASDHSSFYGKNIPVLFLSSGAHTDYHTPADDVEYLNIDGMIRISGFAGRILSRLDTMETGLTFREAGPRTMYSARRYEGITLGIMPDFTDSDDRIGMRVDQVNPGGPAGKGGMKKGDYIMAIEGNPINGIYDYMYRLSKARKGQIIIVTVKRNEQELDLLVQL